MNWEDVDGNKTECIVRIHDSTLVGNVNGIERYKLSGNCMLKYTSSACEPNGRLGTKVSWVGIEIQLTGIMNWGA